MTACTEQPNVTWKKEEPEKILHIDVAAPFDTFDLSDDSTSGSSFIHPFLFSTLFTLTDEGGIGPALSTAWNYAEESKSWTVTIRGDVFFHSGSRVIASDVKSSLLRFFERADPAVYSEVQEISIISDHCLSIALRVDDREFLRKIRQIPIVPASREGQSDDLKQPVGSGPFRFSYRIDDKEVGLVANERDYRGRPSIDKIVFHYVADSQVSWARLLKGETHIAFGITPKDWAILEQYRDRFHLKTRALPYFVILLYNTSDLLFQSPKVRWAMTQAINRAYIVERIIQGFGEVASGPVWSHSPFHNPEITPVPYDPGHALELLSEEGWHLQPNGCVAKDGKCFEFTIFLFEGLEVHRRIGEYIQLCLNDLGLKAHLQSVRHDQLIQKYAYNKEFQAVLTKFRGVHEDLRPAQGLWCTGSGKTAFAGCFADSEVDSLVYEAVKEDDSVKKRTLLNRFESRLVYLQPGALLYYDVATDVISKKIRLPSPIFPNESGMLAIAFADLQ